MTPVTQTCRDVSQLSPQAQTAIRAFFYECSRQGINVFVTETYRSQARQNYLYEQGRTRLYDATGKKLKVVTWTKSSRHTSRLAWDIAHVTTNPEDLYNIGVLTKAGAIARKLGITWGGDWKSNIDRPHFEVTSGWRLPAGYDSKVIAGVKVPSTSAGKVALTVSDGKNEEAKVMATSNVWNPQSPSMKTAAQAYLTQACKDGIINDTHAKAVSDGTMTTDRLLGLFMTVEQRRQTK